MGVKLTLDPRAIGRLWESAKKAAVMTAEALHEDLVSSQTMPYNVGTMQNDNTFTDAQDDGDAFTASVITGGQDSPQARRLYFHPEYNFQKVNNPNAGGEWLEPYIDGEKQDFVEEKFAGFMKEEIGK